MAQSPQPGTLIAPAPESTGYYRCASCGYVLGPQTHTPGRCPNCTSTDTFAPTEIVFPPRPSDAAIARDTRAAETAIRTAYARLAAYPGEIVPLTAIRAALYDGPDRESIDAALTKLAAHRDVHLLPRTDQQQADPATQAAALNFGGGYSHTLMIDPHLDITATLRSIRSTSRVQAESILAALDDDDVTYLADRLEMDTVDTVENLRDRIAAQADANRQAWLADACQGAADGTLLYRADTEPDWVAGWSEADRQAAREAAARLLERADREDIWAYIRDRATRWS